METANSCGLRLLCFMRCTTWVEENFSKRCLLVSLFVKSWHSTIIAQHSRSIVSICSNNLTSHPSQSTKRNGLFDPRIAEGRAREHAWTIRCIAGFRRQGTKSPYGWNVWELLRTHQRRPAACALAEARTYSAATALLPETGSRSGPCLTCSFDLRIMV
jgi:hypothetical protein